MDKTVDIKEIKNAEYEGYFGFDSWGCPTCRKDLTNKPNFCPNCGQKLKYERRNEY